LKRILFTRFFIFCLGAELLNFAVFSLIFDARIKTISGLDTVIPFQDVFKIRFLKFCLGAARYSSSKLESDWEFVLVLGLGLGMLKHSHK